jgi:periplasmic copper chaperone A
MSGLAKRCGVAAIALLMVVAAVARAEPMATVGEMSVYDAWARASLGQTKTSAAYLTLEVSGDRIDRLIAAASPVAESAELHSHVMDGDVARMRPVTAIEIVPGTPTVLEPGGLHLMLTGLRRPLVEGETVPLSLTFENAGTIELEVPIKGIGSRIEHGGHQPATN